MMSVNERFYLSHPPPWWIFGILCGAVPLIVIGIALVNGQMVGWDTTVPLSIVCLAVITVSILSATRLHRQTGSCFWESRTQEPPDDYAQPNYKPPPV
jgi:hypothetical protein